MKLAKDPGGIFMNMSCLTWASLVVLVVKNPPANTKDMGSCLFPTPWSRKWQPAPIVLPGKFHGQRSLGCATLHGVAKSWTQLSTQHTRLIYLKIYSTAY